VKEFDGFLEEGESLHDYFDSLAELSKFAYDRYSHGDNEKLEECLTNLIGELIKLERFFYAKRSIKPATASHDLAHICSEPYFTCGHRSHNRPLPPLVEVYSKQAPPVSIESEEK